MQIHIIKIILLPINTFAVGNNVEIKELQIYSEMFLRRQNIVEPFSAKDVREDLQAGIVGTMPNKRPSPRRSVHSTFKYWTLIDYNVLKYQISTFKYPSLIIMSSNIKYQLSNIGPPLIIMSSNIKRQTRYFVNPSTSYCQF